MDNAELPKRKWVYVMRPSQYEIAGCKCGNLDPDWSEFEKHLWCKDCEIDFIPEHGGIFDGPIPVACSYMLGMSFDRINLETKQLEKFEFLPVEATPSTKESDDE